MNMNTKAFPGQPRETRSHSRHVHAVLLDVGRHLAAKKIKVALRSRVVASLRKYCVDVA